MVPCDGSARKKELIGFQVVDKSERKEIKLDKNLIRRRSEKQAREKTNTVVLREKCDKGST